MQEMPEMLFQSLGQEEPLEEEMATHFSILDWKIPWTEKPRGLQSMESQRVKHDWAHAQTHQNGQRVKLFEWHSPPQCLDHVWAETLFVRLPSCLLYWALSIQHDVTPKWVHLPGLQPSDSKSSFPCSLSLLQTNLVKGYCYCHLPHPFNLCRAQLRTEFCTTYCCSH